MLTTNLVLVFAISGVMALLMILQFFLAARHDHVVSAAGPLQSLDAIEEQIKQRRAMVTDIDEELGTRREALANFAAVQADVEECVRRRDELLAEWNSLEEKRSEVRAIRAEAEQAIAEKQTATSDLSSLKAELEELRERRTNAERLLARVEVMKAEHDELLPRVEQLRDQLRELAEAEGRVDNLESHARDLEAASARLDGHVAAQNAQLEETRTRLATEREALASAQSEQVQIMSEIASTQGELRRLRGEVDNLAGNRTTLEARLAYLEGRTKELEGKTGRTADAEGANDPLRELKAIPPVLINLKSWHAMGLIREEEALHRVASRLQKSGLEFHTRVVRAFHTAMKVNETAQMAVLAGISGTGKSQLPRVYAAGMGIGFLHVPIQPRWDSPQDLMGFYNYIEGRFRPTDMAKALWQLDDQNPESEFGDRMMLILLDEMNLARVEYYFSDFLSRLESRPPPSRVGEQNLRKDAEIELEIPTPKGKNTLRIFPGYNLLFAGTMNEDESTQSLSDKVVDRANVLRFAAPKKIMSGITAVALPEPDALSRKCWSGWVKPISRIEGERHVTDSVERMVQLMKDFKRPFGHRLGRAIMAYVANYPDVSGANRVSDALADQVEMRLLPKLRAVEIDSADSVFSDLRTFVEQDLRDELLAQAIGDSVEAARERTGQFVWQGTIR